MQRVRLAAENPQLYREALAALPNLEALAAPTGERGVVEAVQPITLMWPPKDLPAEKEAAAAWWIIFRRALSDIPRSALDLAVAEYLKTSKYPKFPTPGDLRALAEPHTRAINRVVARIQMMSRQPAPTPPRTAEERAADRQKLIDEGLMTPDGKMILNFKPHDPNYGRVPGSGETRQEMAARLRATADRQDMEKAAGGDAPTAG